MEFALITKHMDWNLPWTVCLMANDKECKIKWTAEFGLCFGVSFSTFKGSAYSVVLCHKEDIGSA